MNFDPDEAYYQRVAESRECADKLKLIRYPCYIFKFKTLEQVNGHREEIELAHAIKLRWGQMKQNVEGK